MKELIAQQTMSSREIAELTGKRHSDVLESIRNMEPARVKVTGRKFPLSGYVDAKGDAGKFNGAKYDMKSKSDIFAAVSDQGTISNISKRGFLYPFDCLYLQRYRAVSNPMIPASYVKPRFLGRKLGGETAFFFLHTLVFHVSMTKEMKNANRANNSSRMRTPNGAKSVSYSTYLAEVNAKNEAYYFILSSGLCDRFKKFCENRHSDDPHRDCLNYLVSKIQQQ